jgi:adenylate kinase family enzyme
VERVVILGRGAAGKTTAAKELGRITGLPVVELDEHFWSAELRPTPPAAWSRQQHHLAAANCWIMDGDLGPYDVLAPRLKRADTVFVLDFGLVRCAWRAARRSREHRDFWWWLLTWRHRPRRAVLHAIARYAEGADVWVITSP